MFSFLFGDDSSKPPSPHPPSRSRRSKFVAMIEEIFLVQRPNEDVVDPDSLSDLSLQTSPEITSSSHAILTPAFWQSLFLLPPDTSFLLRFLRANRGSLLRLGSSPHRCMCRLFRSCLSFLGLGVFAHESEVEGETDSTEGSDPSIQSRHSVLRQRHALRIILTLVYSFCGLRETEPSSSPTSRPSRRRRPQNDLSDESVRQFLSHSPHRVFGLELPEDFFGLVKDLIVKWILQTRPLPLDPNAMIERHRPDEVEDLESYNRLAGKPSSEVLLSCDSIRFLLTLLTSSSSSHSNPLVEYIWGADDGCMIARILHGFIMTVSPPDSELGLAASAQHFVWWHCVSSLTFLVLFRFGDVGGNIAVEDSNQQITPYSDGKRRRRGGGGGGGGGGEELNPDWSSYLQSCAGLPVSPLFICFIKSELDSFVSNIRSLIPVPGLLASWFSGSKSSQHSLLPSRIELPCSILFALNSLFALQRLDQVNIERALRKSRRRRSRRRGRREIIVEEESRYTSIWGLFQLLDSEIPVSLFSSFLNFVACLLLPIPESKCESRDQFRQWEHLRRLSLLLLRQWAEDSRTNVATLLVSEGFPLFDRTVSSSFTRTVNRGSRLSTVVLETVSQFLRKRRHRTGRDDDQFIEVLRVLHVVLNSCLRELVILQEFNWTKFYDSIVTLLINASSSGGGGGGRSRGRPSTMIQRLCLSIISLGLKNVMDPRQRMALIYEIVRRPEDLPQLDGITSSRPEFRALCAVLREFPLPETGLETEAGVRRMIEDRLEGLASQAVASSRARSRVDRRTSTSWVPRDLFEESIPLAMSMDATSVGVVCSALEDASNVVRRSIELSFS